MQTYSYSPLRCICTISMQVQEQKAHAVRSLGNIPCLCNVQTWDSQPALRMPQGWPQGWALVPVPYLSCMTEATIFHEAPALPPATGSGVTVGKWTCAAAADDDGSGTFRCYNHVQLLQTLPAQVQEWCLPLRKLYAM